MFEDSLFDSGAGRRPRKNWTKLASFAIEVCGIGVLVVLPLIYTQALPKQMGTSILEAPSPPGAAPKELRRQPRVERASHDARDGVLREPSYIPRATHSLHDEPTTDERPPSLGDFVLGGTGNGGTDRVIREIARSVPPTEQKPAPTEKLRVSSRVAAGMLVYQLKPQYPPLAVQARIQGAVVLHAVIGKDGKVHELHLISGHPMLTPAAIEAVKQWRYRSYMLNGEPVEVDTQINVNFTLGGG